MPTEASHWDDQRKQKIIEATTNLHGDPGRIVISARLDAKAEETNIEKRTVRTVLARTGDRSMRMRARG